MRELTRNQIIQALECCEQHGNCKECPLNGTGIKGCIFYAMYEARELIKELVDEIKFQEEQYDRVYEQAEADIHGNMADGGTSCHWCIDKTKADTVKRMQERLKELYTDKIITDDMTVAIGVIKQNIDDVAEELLEENK